MRSRYLVGAATVGLICGLTVPASAAPSAPSAVTPVAASTAPGGGFPGEAAKAYKAGIEGYLVGYPLVVMRRTEAVQTCSTGVNVLHNSARLFTSADRDVVAPNNDTIYSNGWLDLRPGPQLLTLPRKSADRYFSFALLDMYTNNVAVLHGGDSGRARFLIAGPGWHGHVPSGVTLVRSPTPDMWVIGRTFVKGPADLDAAAAFQQKYKLTGPAGTPVVPPGTDCTTLPTPQSVGSNGIAFFDELSAGLAADPPVRADARALRPLYRVGAGPGQTPSQSTNQAVVAGLTAAVGTAQQYVAQNASTTRASVNGWAYSPVIGVYGTHYLARTVIALAGLGALPRSEAMYYSSPTMTSTNTYVLHFPAGQLPPHRKSGFWSVTMYGPDRFLVDNPIDRYDINSADPDLVYNADGSLDLYLQHDPPTGHESNWLPAPEGSFYVILRDYLPTAAPSNGTWKPPVITTS